MSVTKVSSPMIESGTKGADIASAATVVIGTDGSYFDITGTTGISTQFTVDAGRRFTLQFDGAVTITDNAALTLSGAANFTTAAGDILSFVAVAANTVVQTGYSLVDGGSPVAPAAGGAWTLIGSQVATDDANLSQTGLDSTYDTYAIVLSDILMANDANHLYLRVGDSGGYDSGSTDYFWHIQVGVSSSGYGTNAVDGSADPEIRIGSNVGNASGEGMGALFYLSRPGDGTSYPMIHGTWSGLTPSTTMEGGVLMGIRKAVITLDRLQIFPYAGNITSGRMSVYGISHS